MAGRPPAQAIQVEQDKAFLRASACKARSLNRATGIRHIIGNLQPLAPGRHIVPIRLAAESNEAEFS
jgi:hypothetical protein